MDGVTLRVATAADADAIGVVTHEAYLDWVEVIGREPLPMTVDYAEAVAAHRFDLLFVGPRLVALIETTPEEGWLLIVNVAVLPTFQGRGYGARLLRLAERLAAEAGLRGTRLYTNQRFETNLRLYAGLGYVVEREETSERGVTVHMRKDRPAG
ncbi:MAG TPA: GNAT family N-acetyltransferase [Caulobacteraceae bacterium]|jgi:GNAT superfamily N-acetyltransferase|nr:GNAT family N-acetyltransferase [Caulobacteraceae bacterium]